MDKLIQIADLMIAIAELEAWIIANKGKDRQKINEARQQIIINQCQLAGLQSK